MASKVRHFIGRSYLFLRGLFVRNPPLMLLSFTFLCLGVAYWFLFSVIWLSGFLLGLSWFVFLLVYHEDKIIKAAKWFDSKMAEWSVNGNY